jgi:hypothetical protein
VKVTGTWKPIKAPITVTLRLEMITPPGSTDDWANVVNKVASARLTPVTIKSGHQAGTTVNFKIDVRQRMRFNTPSPCYHQILLTDTPGFRSFVDEKSTGPAVGGVWATDDPAAYPHEMGHLMGLDDHYTDYFHTSAGANIPLPRNGLEGDALQAALPRGSAGRGPRRVETVVSERHHVGRQQGLHRFPSCASSRARRRSTSTESRATSWSTRIRARRT